MPHCLGQDTSASDPAYPLNCNNLQGQLQSDCKLTLQTGLGTPSQSCDGGMELEQGVWED